MSWPDVDGSPHFYLLQLQRTRMCELYATLTHGVHVMKQQLRTLTWHQACSFTLIPSIVLHTEIVVLDVTQGATIPPAGLYLSNRFDHGRMTGG